MGSVRSLLVHILGAALAAPCAAEETAEPQWIWTSNAAGPDEVAHFRRVFEAAEGDQVRIAVTADNEYELYFNGRLVGAETGDGLWQQAEGYDVSNLVVAGTNAVAVRVRNLGGPGAVVVAVTLTHDGQSQSYGSDEMWRASRDAAPDWRSPDFDDEEWLAAVVLGSLSTAQPWAGQVVLPAEYRTIAAPRTREPFELLDGDRVVLLGSTFIERMARDSFLESALTARWPDRRVAFRNLGWSGDNVWCEARSYFGPPAEGFQRLQAVLGQVQPTVVLVNYGAVESFAGEAGLAAFEEQYHRLLAELEATGALIVLLGPTPHEDVGPPLPDSTQHNRDLRTYSDAVAAVAQARGHRFVDLFALLGSGRTGRTRLRLTDNGLHFTPYGYATAAQAIERGLGLEPLALDERPYADELREAIRRKNELFFHRWRPQNETYLFGFRKHEQGNNAVEVPQFDPLVEAAEARIADIVRP
jgi:lysophospholipase L1-like esterase